MAGVKVEGDRRVAEMIVYRARESRVDGFTALRNVRHIIGRALEHQHTGNTDYQSNAVVG